MVKSISKKIFICIIFIAFILCVFVSHTTYAKSIIAQGTEFLQEGESVNKKINTAKLKETSEYITNHLIIIGIIIAVVVAMILGIQFMVASADEKAKVKESVLPFIVGCIVIFGAFTIWKTVVKIGNRTEGTVDSLESSDLVICYSCGKQLSGDKKSIAIRTGICPICYGEFN